MRIGIVGAGKIGSTLATLWTRAGHKVLVASRHPETLAKFVEQLGQSASAGTPTKAITFGGVILLAVPLEAVPDLVSDLRSILAGKIVLDTGNAYVARDGDLAREAARHPAGSAGWAASMFPEARWVKAFNT